MRKVRSTEVKRITQFTSLNLLPITDMAAVLPELHVILGPKQKMLASLTAGRRGRGLRNYSWRVHRTECQKEP